MRKILLILCLAISTTVYSQNKPVIAVGEITSAVGNFNTLSIQLSLENALQKTNKYACFGDSPFEPDNVASFAEEGECGALGPTLCTRFIITYKSTFLRCFQ